MEPMYEFKQMIVIRKDLNMRKGKMVAQGAHASLSAVMRYKEHDYFKLWFTSGQAKICVSVDSEEELVAIYNAAEKAGLPRALTIDAGFTEFKGVATITAAAIGPAPVDMIDKITSHLKLL